MASFNRVIMLARLTRDPESRSFANGGKVTKFGVAADADRRKDQATGKWESVPVFIDCEVFNRGDYGKLADLVADKCRKGSQILIEGKLHLEQWDDKNGQKRSKHKIVVDSVQLLDGRGDGNSHRETQGGQPSGNHSSTTPPDGGVDDSLPF